MGRTKALVGLATAGAMLLAVVAVRPGTAADDDDLAVGFPEPSPAPSQDASEGALPADVLLEADGLPGLRLGSTSPPEDAGGEMVETPAGCRMVWDPASGTTGSDLRPDHVTWEASTWVVDEEVVSVQLSSFSDDGVASTQLRTWLGPTLGSPLTAAQDLPDARTVVERPDGPAGPTVTVVTVVTDGVEVVFSDAPTGPPVGGADQGDDEPGPIGTVEVRRSEAGVCAMADYDDLLTDPTTDAVATLDLDGLGPLRLGTPVQGLAAEGVTEQATGVPGCRAFDLESAMSWARAVAEDDVVTEVQVFGLVGTSFGLPPAADADQVKERFPELAPRSDQMLTRGQLEVDVAGTTVVLQMWPDHVWVPEVERPVEGSTVQVQSIGVRAQGATPALC